MLDLKKLLYNVVDRLNTLTSGQSTLSNTVSTISSRTPMSQGKSGKWYYRVWRDGTYELWYNSGQTTITTGTSGGNGWYRNSSEYTINMPTVPFNQFATASVEHAEISVNTDYAYVVTSITHSNTTYLGYYVSHLGSLSSVTAYIGAYVFGTWTEPE